MKGEQADYVIPLERAFSFPPKKRVTKAIAVIRQFVRKHTHFAECSVSNEVNHYLHRNSKNIPHNVNATLLIDGGKAHVFLQGGNGLAEHKKNKEAEKKRKEQKKEEKKADREAVGAKQAPPRGGALPPESGNLRSQGVQPKVGPVQSKTGHLLPRGVSDEEQARKLEEKKEKEEAAKAAEIKRKTA